MLTCWLPDKPAFYLNFGRKFVKTSLKTKVEIKHLNDSTFSILKGVSYIT